VDIGAALTAAVPVIAALTTGIVLIIREIRKVHTIVNNQRTEMVEKIERLEDALRVERHPPSVLRRLLG